MLHIIAKKSQIPVIADVHFQPGTSSGHRRRPRRCRQAAHQPRQHRRARCPLRADRRSRASRRHPDAHRRQRRVARTRTSPEVRLPGPPAMVESALRSVDRFEADGFTTSSSRSKRSDVLTGRRVPPARREGDYPLHIGVTEAGKPPRRHGKSASGSGILLDEASATRSASRCWRPGPGDRRRLRHPAARAARAPAGNRVRCPTCGRCEIDLNIIAEWCTGGLARHDRAAEDQRARLRRQRPRRSARSRHRHRRRATARA